MNAQISEEVHALCRRYQALALNEDPTTLTIALNEEAPQAAGGAAFRHRQAHPSGTLAGGRWSRH